MILWILKKLGFRSGCFGSKIYIWDAQNKFCRSCIEDYYCVDDMKEGDKRINNDNFERVVTCDACQELFWAISEWELGNWQRECKKCRDDRAKKEDERNKEIVRNGKPRHGNKGKIFAWTLGEEIYHNPEYEPSSETVIYTRKNGETITEAEYFANGFMDLERIEKAYAKAESVL